MFEWSDEQVMLRDAVRQFIEKEIAPIQDELEHGDMPPYDVLRKLFATFGMDVMARERLQEADRVREVGRGGQGQGRGPSAEKPGATTAAA